MSVLFLGPNGIQMERSKIDLKIPSFFTCYLQPLRAETEAILLVDAENAFNNLNREAALKNIKVLCPPLHQYLHNTYQKPAKLVISGENQYDIIYSEEGTIQGDVAAMAQYGLRITPPIRNLANKVDNTKCKQVRYADDSSSAGKLEEIKKWWIELCEAGPKYGYYPYHEKRYL